MENIEILEKIRAEYYNLTASERKIADYIWQNAEKVQLMSITELAGACEVADATVSRFCRSLDQSGFSGFKLELAKSIATAGEQKCEHCDDSVLGRSRKTGILVQRAIEETIQLADEETVKQAVTLMEKADKVLCLGSGGAIITAWQFAHIFSTICNKCTVADETHLQYMALASMTTRDVLIVLSHSGATRGGIEMLKQAKSYGINTILITHFPQSPAAEYADIILRSGFDENPLEIGAMPARVSALMVVDMLFQEYYNRNKTQCEAYRRRVAEALATQHV